MGFQTVLINAECALARRIRRHLRGRTALQADTKGVADIRGRCPRLLTVQPSRLDSLACLILPL